MRILLETHLRDYMLESNLQNILITSMIRHTWSGSTLETSARFVDSEEAKLLKEEDHYLSFPNSVGEVLIQQIPSLIDDPVRLGLGQYSRQITVQGIHST